MAAVLKVLCAVVVAMAALASPPAIAEVAIPGLDVGVLRFQALPPQPLQNNHCGLFLWSRAGERPVFILVAYDSPAEARLRTDGRVWTIPRTAFEGEPVLGHFQQQSFSNGRLTLDLELRFESQRELRDGVIIEQGVLRVRDDDGWESVTPVGGMIACKR